MIRYFPYSQAVFSSELSSWRRTTQQLLSPSKGKIVFGLGCGIITFVIRHFGSYPEGVSFSILLMNVLTPYIEQLTRTKIFGAKEAEKNEG